LLVKGILLTVFLFRSFTGEGTGGERSQTGLLLLFIASVKASSSEVFAENGARLIGFCGGWLWERSS